MNIHSRPPPTICLQLNSSPLIPPTPTICLQLNSSPLIPPTPTICLQLNSSPLIPPSPTIFLQLNSSPLIPPSSLPAALNSSTICSAACSLCMLLQSTDSKWTMWVVQGSRLPTVSSASCVHSVPNMNTQAHYFIWPTEHNFLSAHLSYKPQLLTGLPTCTMELQ